MTDWKQDLLDHDLEFYTRAVLALHDHLKIATDNAQPDWFRASNAHEAAEWARIAATQIKTIRGER